MGTEKKEKWLSGKIRSRNLLFQINSRRLPRRSLSLCGKTPPSLDLGLAFFSPFHPIPPLAGGHPSAKTRNSKSHPQNLFQRIQTNANPKKIIYRMPTQKRRYSPTNSLRCIKSKNTGALKNATQFLHPHEP